MYHPGVPGLRVALPSACLLVLASACASAPPVPPAPPPAPPVLAVLAPAPPDLPPTGAERLAEAERLLADGVRLDRVATLLAAVSPAGPRLDRLLGQLAELRRDDAGAVEAYQRALAQGEDPEVRLRWALALERLGRGAEAEAALRRLRPAAVRAPAEEARPARRLRPLLPSSR